MNFQTLFLKRKMQENCPDRGNEANSKSFEDFDDLRDAIRLSQLTLQSAHLLSKLVQKVVLSPPLNQIDFSWNIFKGLDFCIKSHGHALKAFQVSFLKGFSNL